MLLRRTRPGVRTALAPPAARAQAAAGDHKTLLYYQYLLNQPQGKTNESKLSTTDLLVLASMKNAAKCDK
jgi:hypothetical protein